MSDAKVRFVELQRGSLDLKTGEFPMVLATDGEASDGDILSIEGAEYKSRLPLQIAHINDPRETLGSITRFRRDLSGKPKKLRAIGQIDMGGEGPTADIRRDIAYLISQGHITGVSVRWDPVKYAPRARLPKGHPASVGEDESDYRKLHGNFFEKWRAREGSIAPIQSDQEAIVGRSRDESLPDHVRSYWRAVASEYFPEVSAEDAAPQPPVEPVEPPAEEPASVEPESAAEPVVEPEAEPAPVEAAPARVEPEPVEDDDEEDEAEEARLAEALSRVDALEAELAALRGREQGSPSEQADAAAKLRSIMAEADQRHQQRLSDFNAYVGHLRGRVCRDEAEAAAIARFKKVIETVKGVQT